MKYRCNICGYVYDEEKEERPMSDVDYCPSCHMDQTHFVLIEEDEKDD